MINNLLLDTNVVIRNLDNILKSKSNVGIIIPMTVLEELDNIKTREGETGFLARESVRLLFDIRKYGRLNEWVKLDNDLSIKVESKFDDKLNISYVNNDDLILGTLSYCNNKYGTTTLLSNDINLCLKAEGLGFSFENVNENEDGFLYEGHIKIYTNEDVISQFYKQGYIDWQVVLEEEPIANTCVTMICETFNKQQALSIYRKGKLQKLNYGNNQVFGNIKGQNRQQKYLIEMLMDDDIRIVAVNSNLGTGKSFISTAVALQKVLEENKYKKILYIKPHEPMGQRDIGYLPSSKNEKLLDGYSGTIKNILENIFTEKENDGKGNLSYAEYLIEKGILQVEAMTFMRGMSYANYFIIIDEASNISKTDIKNITGRTGKGSKIVIIGDIDQRDNQKLNKYNNGLTHLISKFKSADIFATIKLDKSVRSEVAQLCVDRL